MVWRVDQHRGVPLKNTGSSVQLSSLKWIVYEENSHRRVEQQVDAI